MQKSLSKNVVKCHAEFNRRKYYLIMFSQENMTNCNELI